MITREDLQEMFDRIVATNEGRPDWNMAGLMAWGYFFTCSTHEPLQRAAADLEQQGYKVIDIRLSDKNGPSEADLWWLHVESVETHSVDTLFARCERLYEFALGHRLDSYDGVDVGPAERPPLSS